MLLWLTWNHMGATCIRSHSIYRGNTCVAAIIGTNGCRADCVLIARGAHQWCYTFIERIAGDAGWSCCTCQHNSVPISWTTDISCQCWCGWFVWGSRQKVHHHFPTFTTWQEDVFEFKFEAINSYKLGRTYQLRKGIFFKCNRMMQYFAETYTSCRSQCTPFIYLCHCYTAIKTGQDKTKRPWNINIWLYNRV